MKITKEIKELVKLRVSAYYEVKKDEIRKQEKDEQAERASKTEKIVEDYNALLKEHTPALIKLIQEELMKKHPDTINEKELNKAINQHFANLKLIGYYRSSFITQITIDDSGTRLWDFGNIYKALDVEKENAILETIISLEFGSTKDDLDAVLEKFRIPEAE